MKKILFFIFLLPCLLTKNYAQDWLNFSSSEGKFSVLLPTEPSLQVDSSSTYPAYVVKMLKSKGITDVFMVGWVDYELSYTFDVQKELENTRDVLIKGINGNLISSKNIMFKGYNGLEFSAQSGSFFCTSKVFVVGRRPYQLLAGSTTGKASENEIKFYNSFFIKKD